MSDHRSIIFPIFLPIMVIVVFLFSKWYWRRSSPDSETRENEEERERSRRRQQRLRDLQRRQNRNIAPGSLSRRAKEARTNMIMTNIIIRQFSGKAKVAHDNGEEGENVSQSGSNVAAENAKISDTEAPSLKTSPTPICSICLDPYKDGDDVCSSKIGCEHEFHLSCILEWLMRKENMNCPICRCKYIEYTPNVDNAGNNCGDDDSSNSIH